MPLVNSDWNQAYAESAPFDSYDKKNGFLLYYFITCIILVDKVFTYLST